MTFGYYKNYLYTHRYKLSSEKKNKKIKSPSRWFRTPKPVRIRQSGRTGNRGMTGSLRDKKESCSTRRGLRVGTRFMEFPQTPRGKGFSLLEFYSYFKCFVDVLVE